MVRIIKNQVALEIQAHSSHFNRTWNANLSLLCNSLRFPDTESDIFAVKFIDWPCYLKAP